MAYKTTFTNIPSTGAPEISRGSIASLFAELEERLQAISGNVNGHLEASLLGEIKTKLHQVKTRYDDALMKNDEYLTIYHSGIPKIDPSKGALSWTAGGKKYELIFPRANESKPVQIQKLFESAIFVPGTSSLIPAVKLQQQNAELDLSAKVEDYYYSASRFWDLVEQGYSKKGKSKFIGVKMVRNRLFEHSMSGAINSFAASDIHGPIVKPERREGESEEHLDSGMIPNTAELLKNCIARLSI
ncbi:hypothetical protein [Pseudooceanicola sp. LIPI14-2-Ac024]|uniref:hypothetical protein n=1 Tax=Pseudooceanicola sp. LIPI14-2-Ac024 TaxID=3344875 RepID=UPI0035D0971E